MATDKPRITISLAPEHYAILQRLAKLQKAPMSRLITELVEEVSPVLSKVADSLEIAMRAQEGVRVQLRRAADEAEEELRPLVNAVKNQFDLFNAQAVALMEPLASAAGGADAGAAGIADAPADVPLAAPAEGGRRRRPPSSNTGATDSQREGRKAGVKRSGRAVRTASPGSK